MRSIDLVIVVAFLAGLVLLAGWLARRQKDATDYYLGGRRLSAWALGVSLAANQVSAISLVGAPAFVALREGGGLKWLQYELAVPLSMAALVLWGVPVLRRARGANVYEAIEDRLGPAARRLRASFFLLGRGLGSGVILYASALVVAALTGWGLGMSLIVVALVAAVYTSLGGLAADVISDILQFGLLWGGTLLASVVLAVRLAAAGPVLDLIERSRLVPLDMVGHGLGDGATFGFWPMLFGGFFLYLAYYGCDQTQAQRIIAASTDGAARKALFLAAVLRFPLVLTYCVFGLLLAAFLVVEPSFAAGLVGRPPDALVPEFVVAYLPVGVLGVAVAGFLAAALSSIDSALNSMSAVTMEEFFPSDGEAAGRVRVFWARFGTLAWGAWAAAAGWWLSTSGETVIETINRVGSVLYGPMLALFLLAWRSKRADGRSAVAGGLTGVAANILLAYGAPGVSWLWWNLAGCLVAVLIGHFGGRVKSSSSGERPARSTTVASDGKEAHKLAGLLAAEFAAILTLLVALTVIFR
jgi:SSS family solute:Na+ symporter